MTNTDPNSELIALEKKVEQFLAFCETLRVENLALRSRVITLEEERTQLTRKMDSARTRLETLMTRLPNE